MTKHQAQAAINALDTIAFAIRQGTHATIVCNGRYTLTPQPDGSMQIAYETTNETGA